MLGSQHFHRKLWVSWNISLTGNIIIAWIVVDMRTKERILLEKTAYTQSLSVALTPVVPIIAVIVTFIAHIATGHELTPAEVNILSILLL